MNPAIETVKRLPATIAGAEIIKLEIPTVCHKSLRVIGEAVAAYDPDVVLSIGQAGPTMKGIRLSTSRFMPGGRPLTL